MQSRRPRSVSATPYRKEEGRICIDLRLHSARQLFDSRDPAPFRERDLDEDAVDYVVDSVEEAPPRLPLKLVVWITDPAESLPDATIVAAIHTHFHYLLDRVGSNIRKHLRQGQLKLLLGLAILGVCLTLSRLGLMFPAGALRDILREGFAIVGWVAMWRPAEVLLYDWWPLVQERHLLQRIALAEVYIQHGPAGSVVPSVATGLPSVPV
jgi:hypothetical protein